MSKLNTKMSLKSVYEAAAKRIDAPFHERLGADSIIALVDEVADDWLSQYDEGDPVQSEYGEDEWNEQCDRAAMMLSTGIEEVIERVEQQLHNGDFAENGRRGAKKKKPEYVHKPFGGAPKGYGQGE